MLDFKIEELKIENLEEAIEVIKVNILTKKMAYTQKRRCRAPSLIEFILFCYVSFLTALPLFEVGIMLFFFPNLA